MIWLRRVLACSWLAGLVFSLSAPSLWFARRLGWLADVQFVPALLAVSLVALTALILLAVVFGRIYCSILCPLGVAQDVARACLRSGWRCSLSRRVHLAILVLTVISAVFGSLAVLDPYGIFSRFVCIGVMQVGEPPHALVIIAIAPLTLILAMTVFRARWWCNQVCPVGALLGLFSSRAVLRPRIDDNACRRCGRCVAACDKGAIEIDDAGMVRVVPQRCVVCLKCIGSCKFKALSWKKVARSTNGVTLKG